MSYKTLTRYLFMLTILLFSTTAVAQKLKVSDLVCEYRKNPDLLDSPNPRLSWKLASEERNTMQTAYEVKVGTSAKATGSWSTGKVNSDQSVLVPYAGSALLSGQKYYWQVRVWDNHGNASGWSAIQSWQMGLLNKTDWQAKWIQPAQPTDGKVSPVPTFRKGFKLAGAVKSARLYITSLGLYEANINGKRVGDRYFAPGWTSYHNRLQYQAYDVTDLLNKGDNVAGVMVGDGWYRGNLAFSKQRNLYGKEVGLLFQMEVEYVGGKKEIIVSDNSWKSSLDGPIRASDIYNGETYDAILATTAWLKPGYNDNKWQGVKLMEPYTGQLLAQVGPPVRKHEVFKAVKIFTAANGETIVDFGQNLVGWEQLKIKGNRGDSIIVRHAEVLDKAGVFYTDNLRGAQQINRYVLSGETETFEPHFTFQGFRYIAIKGLKGALNPADVSAIAVYSDMPLSGTFSSSNPLINQLQHNIVWGQKGNFVDVPTDCPQRDERLGWTGDAQVFFNTAAYNRNVAGFFTKWLGDVKADQLDNGNVPVVIPNVLSKNSAGTAGWSDVATIIPWNFYMAYGDKQLLGNQYPSMKAWVGYMEKHSTNDLLGIVSSYGDWLFYSPDDDKSGKAAITDKALITQAFYAYSTQLMINAATVLDNKTDVEYYSALLKRIKDAFIKEYVTPSGRMVSNTQTAYVLALNFDLLPESLRAQAAKRLADNVKEYNNHLTTGFIGTPYLCHVLSRFGYTDVAYKLLMQDTYPSWLYPVKMGATTIWERWDGIKPDGTFENIKMNSFNHYAYGAIGDWMYRVAAGINQDTLVPGYKQIVIAPKPGGGLTSTTAELETVYGKVSSSWKLDGKTFNLDVVIPANTTARIVLPNASAVAIMENGADISKLNMAKPMVKQGADVQLQLGSGTYHFSYQTTN
jgi:alpha-L-rhamnosidase